MKKIENYLKPFVDRGGPEPNEYLELNDYFSSINSRLKIGRVSREQIRGCGQLAVMFFRRYHAGFCMRLLRIPW